MVKRKKNIEDKKISKNSTKLKMVPALKIVEEIQKPVRNF
jgi:hypothetical protein